MGMVRRMARRRVIVAGAATGAAAYHYGRKRGQSEADAYQEPPDQGTAYAPPPTREPAQEQSTVDQLNDLAKLHASGVLTDAEFTAAKAKLIG